MIVNHYDILGLKRDAKQHQIKKAYYRLALKWHPDKNAEQRSIALDHFHQISEAYNTLSKVEQKTLYDYQLSEYDSIHELLNLFKRNEQMKENNDFNFSLDNFLTEEEHELIKQFKKKINEPGISKKIRKHQH